MRCDELNRLLQIYRQQKDRDIAFQLITSHILTCLSCARGLHQLSQELFALDSLTCERAARACPPTTKQRTSTTRKSPCRTPPSPRSPCTWVTATSAPSYLTPS